MKNYSCPNCVSKQKVKILFFANNNTSWNCHNCSMRLKFEKFSNNAFMFGFISTAVPAYIALNILHLEIFRSLFIGFIFGLIYYLLVVLYYYYNQKVESEMTL